MIAARLTVDPRRAAELAHRHYERAIQHPALLQVVEQRGLDAVEDRPAPVGEQVEVEYVRIPAEVAVRSHSFDVLAPVHLHVRHIIGPTTSRGFPRPMAMNGGKSFPPRCRATTEPKFGTSAFFPSSSPVRPIDPAFR